MCSVLTNILKYSTYKDCESVYFCKKKKTKETVTVSHVFTAGQSFYNYVMTSFTDWYINISASAFGLYKNKMNLIEFCIQAYFGEFIVRKCY